MLLSKFNKLLIFESACEIIYFGEPTPPILILFNIVKGLPTR